MTELVANIISESMYAQCDIDGNEYLLFKAFINHRTNVSALNVKDQKMVIKWQNTLRKSTAAWDIYCKQKDRSTLWEKLSNLVESYPIQVAKFSVAQGMKYMSQHLTHGLIMF